MKIAIVQFYPYHEEVLVPQIDYLYNNHKLYIAAPESVFNNDYISHYKDKIHPIIYKNHTRKKIFFLTRIFSILYKYIILLKYHKREIFDIIIFNTITYKFHYSIIKLFLKNVKKIQIMHNSQSFIIKNNINYLKLFFNNLIISYDAYSRFKNDINLLFLPPSPPIDWFYPLLSLNIIKDKNNFNIIFDDSYINIVIPGSVDEKRRNYSSLFSALGKYKNKHALKFKIYLLGKISSNIIEKLKNDGLCNIIYYYTEFISGYDMINCIKKADAVAFLLDSKLGENLHLYNNYKVSGTIGLCLSFGSPCIVSDEFFLESTLKNKAIVYPKDNIDYILSQIESGVLTKDYFTNLRSLPLDSKCSYEFQQEHYIKTLGIEND